MNPNLNNLSLGGFLLLGALTAAVATGCKKDADRPAGEPAARHDQPAAGLPAQEHDARLSRILHHYFAWKNALVADDSAASRRHAAELARSVEGRGDTGPVEALPAWAEHSGEMREAAAAGADAWDLKTQRRHFQRASEAVIALAEAAGSPRDTFYVDYCPMAEGNRGAWWLSEAPGIRNPYFGQSMLECGETRRKIVPGAAAPRSAAGSAADHGH